MHVVRVVSAVEQEIFHIDAKDLCTVDLCGGDRQGHAPFSILAGP